MVFSRLRNWCDIRAVPDLRVRPRSEEDVEETQEHCAELRSSSFEEEVVHLVWSARFVTFQVSNDSVKLIFLDATTLEISYDIAQRVVLCVLMVVETATDARTDMLVVGYVSWGENGLWRVS